MNLELFSLQKLLANTVNVLFYCLSWTMFHYIRASVLRRPIKIFERVYLFLFLHLLHHSAGKSFVAEVLMLRRVISTGKMALLVLPYVSICAEKVLYLVSSQIFVYIYMSVIYLLLHFSSLCHSQSIWKDFLSHLESMFAVFMVTRVVEPFLKILQ